MEKDVKEIKQDLEEIEVLDEGMESDIDILGMCCIANLVPLYW